MPGQPSFHWTIRDVQPGELFVIEMVLEGATLTFEWRFAALDKDKTRMTQCIQLTGASAAAYAEQLEQSFRPTLAPGMKRIALEMESKRGPMKR